MAELAHTSMSRLVLLQCLLGMHLLTASGLYSSNVCICSRMYMQQQAAQSIGGFSCQAQSKELAFALAAMAALRSRAAFAAASASAASASLAAMASASCADSELSTRSFSRPSAWRFSSSSPASLHVHKTRAFLKVFYSISLAGAVTFASCTAPKTWLYAPTEAERHCVSTPAGPTACAVK